MPEWFSVIVYKMLFHPSIKIHAQKKNCIEKDDIMKDVSILYLLVFVTLEYALKLMVENATFHSIKNRQSF